ncbi:MAG: DUF1036 domain-containing protein [Pseudomonadota bacterium]
MFTPGIRKLVLGLTLSAAFAGSAQAALSICNDRNREVLVAYAIQSGMSILGGHSKGWVTRGWYSVKPGKCAAYFTRYEAAKSIVAVFDTKGGKMQNLAGTLSVQQQTQPVIGFNRPRMWEASGTSICVQSKITSFRRASTSIAGLKQCPSGYVAVPASFEMHAFPDTQYRRGEHGIAVISASGVRVVERR